MKKTKTDVQIVDLESMMEKMISDANVENNETHNTLMDSEELMFFVHIDDAYHIRNMFDYLRGSNMDANLVFTKDGISYACTNGKETILNTFEIDASSIIYQYNTHYESVVAGINLVLFARTTHNIGKKDIFRMYMLYGQSCIHYEIASMTSIGMSVHSKGQINVKDVDLCKVKIPKNDRPIRKTVPVNMFCHSCSTLANIKCNRVKITQYEKGFLLEGIDNYNQVQNYQAFYPCKVTLVTGSNKTTSIEMISNAIDVPKGEEIQNIYVNTSTIKWIAKLTNVSPHGAKLRFYCDKNEPWCIGGDIGFYGKYNIYIKNEF